MTKYIPILMYHKLSLHKSDNAYTLLYPDFLEHLEYLYSNGFSTILLEDYYEALLDPPIKLPPKSILITFDDGHESDFILALPALKKFNFTGNFFITTDWIGTPGYMDIEQIRVLKKEGMSVQSHSKTHLFLNELNSNEVHHELRESKKKLEEITGTEVSFLSFPGGRFNMNVVSCGKNTGYLALFSSIPFSFKEYEDIFLIGRIGIRYKAGKINFQKLMNPSPPERILIKVSYHAKDLLKKIIGNNLYYFLWQKYINK